MNAYPINVKQHSDRELQIVWNDGADQIIDTVHLRRKCPCASCVDELSGKQLLDPASVSEDVRPQHIKSVGQYALNIEFSDGHRTGFYSFAKLRDLLNKE